MQAMALVEIVIEAECLLVLRPFNGHHSLVVVRG